ncbi:TPA: class I SAM-dependent DNA methyltransferase [Neisseria meningitidis]
MRQISLTDYFCKGLNISPEIFGTLFQSVMDAQERREAGAHYTETANIDKVINGLFLENLRAEFEAVKAFKRDKAKKLAAFYQKIQNLQFLDPACGCGNFLIVAYDRIRALEDDIIAEALKDKAGGLFDSPSVQCRLKQFHGIEIDEFAVLIARTAMWLKNHQCNIRTQIRFDGEVACHTLPLEDAAEIIHANSLRTPWQAVDYIFGNPPLSARPTKPKSRKTTSKASAAISKATACWITSATGTSKPPASWRSIPKFRRHLFPPIPSAKASRSKSSGAAF